MKNIIYTILILSCSSINHLSAQPLYFNYYINPLGTWSSINGGAIIINDTTFIAGIGGKPGFDEKVIIFVKLNSEGEAVFTKTYGEPYCWYYQGFNSCFRPVGDENFIFVIAKRDMITNFASSILYYLNHNFDTLFSKEFTIAEGVWTAARQIMPAFDDGYYVTGIHGPLNDSTVNSNFFILKTDDLFNIEWQQSYSPTWRNEALYMVKTPDNGLLISGFTEDLPSSYSLKPLLIKTDSLGNILWIWNEGSEFDDYPAVATITNDGNYIVAYPHATEQGLPYPVPPSSRVLRVVKFESNGDILWTKDYGSSNIDNQVTSIHSYEDGKHLIGGVHYVDSIFRWKSYILKINDEGDSLWMRHYEHEYDAGIATSNIIYNLKVTPGNGILATGSIVQYDVPGGVQAMWIMHLDSLGCIEKDCDPTVGIPLAFHQNSTGLSVYPNPASNVCCIRIPEDMNSTRNNYFLVQLFNNQGVLVQQTRRKYSEDIISLDTGELPPGLYLLHLTDGSANKYQTKLIVQ